MLIAVAWFLSLVIRFALSRSREFLADAGAVELTKNPDAMIMALRKIENRGELDGVTSAVMEMCVDNPRAGFADMFATHPSIDRRIDALVRMAGGHDPGPHRIIARTGVASTALPDKPSRSRRGRGAIHSPQPQPGRATVRGGRRADKAGRWDRERADFGSVDLKPVHAGARIAPQGRMLRSIGLAGGRRKPRLVELFVDAAVFTLGEACDREPGDHTGSPHHDSRNDRDHVSRPQYPQNGCQKP